MLVISTMPERLRINEDKYLCGVSQMTSNSEGWSEWRSFPDPREREFLAGGVDTQLSAVDECFMT